jgi:hypothetical protein
MHVSCQRFSAAEKSFFGVAACRVDGEEQLVPIANLPLDEVVRLDVALRIKILAALPASGLIGRHPQTGVEVLTNQLHSGVRKNHMHDVSHPSRSVM